MQECHLWQWKEYDPVLAAVATAALLKLHDSRKRLHGHRNEVMRITSCGVVCCVVVNVVFGVWFMVYVHAWCMVQVPRTM
jgi:hypothetical protein